jgi:methylphosphotriester-DNA--protein-cysteine methyltransferase
MKNRVRAAVVVLAACLIIAAVGICLRSNPAQRYVGNVRSHVFHRQRCCSLPSTRNSITFNTRAKATATGYRPCRRCRP